MANKLTENQIAALVADRAAGMAFTALAARYGVGATTAKRYVKKAAEFKLTPPPAEVPAPIDIFTDEAPPVADPAQMTLIDPADVTPAAPAKPALKAQTTLTPAEALAQVSRALGRPIKGDSAPYGSTGDVMIVDLDNRKHVHCPAGLVKVRDQALRKRVRWALGIAAAAGCELMEIKTPKGTRLSVQMRDGDVTPKPARAGETFVAVADGATHPKTGEPFPAGTFQVFQDGEATQRYAMPVGEAKPAKPKREAPAQKYLKLTLVELRKLAKKQKIEGYQTLNATALAFCLTADDTARHARKLVARKNRRSRRNF